MRAGIKKQKYGAKHWEAYLQGNSGKLLSWYRSGSFWFAISIFTPQNILKALKSKRLKP